MHLILLMVLTDYLQVLIYCLVMFLFILDTSINYSSFMMILTFLGALFGFFIINIISGTYFGDLGAYSTGFFISVFGIIIVKEDATVSPWFIFLIILYPGVEIIFLTLRRLISGLPFSPDNKHLHSILYQYIRKITYSL